jgi:DNA-directed RNA polymerase specialized sigma24 family protein
MKARFNRKLISAWQQQFLALLPVIINYVAPAFRNLHAEARAEAVQEAVCNAYVAFHRLMGQGRETLVYPTVLARFAVRQVWAGRQVGTRLNVQDVSSPYAQRRKQIRLGRLDRFDPKENRWLEAVVEDHRTPVPEQASFRVDFPAWLKTLSRRDRKVAKCLAAGHSTGEVARRFGISSARVSQLRRELYESWQQFHGEAATDQHVPLLAAA